MLVKFSEFGRDYDMSYIDEIDLDVIPRITDIVLLRDKRYDDCFSGKVQQIIWDLYDDTPSIIMYLENTINE